MRSPYQLPLPLEPLTLNIREALNPWTDDMLTHELLRRVLDRQEDPATAQLTNDLIINHLKEVLYWAKYQREGPGPLPEYGKKGSG